MDTEATLLTPWGISSFMLYSGIKQGAVESPSFFLHAHGGGPSRSCGGAEVAGHGTTLP